VRGLVWFAVPNGGWRSAIEAAIFKGLGVKAGVADLILLHDGKFFALEVKTETGRVTDAQRAFIEAVIGAGGHGAIGRGVDQCLEILEGWHLLNGQAGANAYPVVT
jgi:VRR-NUC domain